MSARLSDSAFFVIEADEYDTAFFDKRSKFVHYRPRTAILNNLEYDHADIFPDLAAIETQFHHFVRTVPPTGRLVVNGEEASLARVLARGCWSEVERFAAAEFSAPEGGPGPIGESPTTAACRARRAARDAALAGRASAARPAQSIERARGARRSAPLGCRRRSRASRRSRGFRGVKRRLEVAGTVRGVTVYDDFAHHPTAIATTIDGLRREVGSARILAVIEPRSNR